MAPKAASKASAPKKSSSTAAHPTYQDMIKEAVIQLKERNGSSRQTLKKYVMANNSLGNISDAVYTARFNQALAKGSENGTFVRPKGASGPVKLGKAPAATKTAKASSPTATKEAKPKTATKAKTTKAAAPKKAAAATKKTAAKAAPKKTAAKANTGKSRKTAAPAAPAVGEEKTTVLSKTKSGRVSKTTKAPAPKKAASTKKAAPKKAATKKATPKKA
ncbi:linker histone H1 and H5 family-domain-containing protein [Elsinoe ampelina]|uniref:Histone H1 n=1 Tax=Elsinoe ampelina TaxID=302913 RepID=A0A6A6GIC9_9PEZI|nr:linker histone H1 and H5 family-domain-containing protein [Elsinoe ampelina]